jgi:O-antigen/teichoic acid export membrane protein
MIISNVRRNIIANLIARAWGFIATYLFTPLYLHFLGIEAFGLVGFFSVLMGVMVLADMGFTATLNRELARLSVHKESFGKMRDLVRAYELLYFWISSVLIFLIWVLAPIISEYWLNSINLQPHEITMAIRLMGVAIAFQLPSGLFFGGLMGLQRQIQANSIQTAWSVFRGVGTVFVLWLFSQTIIAFALWQMISNAFYCFFVRFSLWRALSSESNRTKPQFKWQIIIDTKSYTIGMAVIAILSTILIQTDKLAVSKMLTLDMLGYYSLASVLASFPLMLANPIVSAIFPQFTGIFEKGDHESLVRLYHKTCKLTSLVIFPAGLTLALFAKDFILAWTSSNVASEEAGLTTSLLLIGQLLQAITLVPFNFALSHGQTKLIVKVQIYSIILITPLLFFLIKNFGLVGGGISWLLMNMCSLLPYMFFFHKKFLPGEFKTWILHDVGQPLLIALPIIIIGSWLFHAPSSPIIKFGMIALIWIVSTIATAFSITEFRDFMVNYVRKKK